LRVDFYHLQTWPLEKALPPLLERALGAGMRAVVLAASDDRVEALASLLWTFRADSWLPHGTTKDGQAVDQPIWLSTRDENPNGANLMVLTDGMATTPGPAAAGKTPKPPGMRCITGSRPIPAGRKRPSNRDLRAVASREGLVYNAAQPQQTCRNRVSHGSRTHFLDH
jgi:DNA polymerase IIIc chi subunit